ncbi:MAG: hypothetical protein MJ108_04320 [Saccharofermentans sp.]|nr:hypothetical protein [Saccharofermentans sp.]
MKKVLSAFLSMIMIAGIIPASIVIADKGNPTENSQKEDTYFCYSEDEENQAKYYYDDAYFDNSSYEYNPSLATMTLCLSMAAANVPDDDYKNGDRNAKALMTDIGMTFYEANEWYNKKPEADSIGVICSAKQMDDYTLVAIVIRGAGYASEWSSNFDMGSSGNHEGFTKAQKDTLDFLDSFMEENGITGDVKFWVTGYSRGAATANLVGGALDDEYDFASDVTYAKEGVYTYTFETPAAYYGMIEGEKYNNIFNIINPNDVVPYVAPAEFGFRRYGIDMYLPSAETSANYYELRKRMLNIYATFPDYSNYIIDDFKVKRADFTIGASMDSIISMEDTDSINTQAIFFKNFISELAGEMIGDRENYADMYETGLRIVLDVMLGGNKGQEKESVTDFIARVISSAENAGFSMSTITDSGSAIRAFIEYMFTSRPYDFATLISNNAGLIQAHDHTICYSWLASMDSNYYQGVINHTNNGDYRIIRVSSVADLLVTDGNGKEVANIQDYKKIPVSGSAYVYGMMNGDMVVVLPVDMDYEIAIDKYKDGPVSVSVSEYSAYAHSVVRVDDYKCSDVSDGDKLIFTVPSYTEEEIDKYVPNGSSCEYRLSASEEVATSSLRGEDTSETFYMIKLESSSVINGMVYGSGKYQSGQNAILEAHAMYGSKFEGWYVGKELYSEDQILNITVSENLDLTAKFSMDHFACNHTSINLLGYTDAECDTDGFNGNVICDGCGKNLNDDYDKDKYAAVIVALTGKLDVPGQKIPAMGHVYDDGICIYCQAFEPGYIPFDEVELLPEEKALIKGDEETVDAPEDSDDYSNSEEGSFWKNIIIWIIPGVSLAAIVVIIVIRRKRKKHI